MYGRVIILCCILYNYLFSCFFLLYFEFSVLYILIISDVKLNALNSLQNFMDISTPLHRRSREVSTSCTVQRDALNTSSFCYNELMYPPFTIPKCFKFIPHTRTLRFSTFEVIHWEIVTSPIQSRCACWNLNNFMCNFKCLSITLGRWSYSLP